MKIAVISPHPDDAVFSVGEHMLSRPEDEFVVICPFMGVPATPEHRHDKHATLWREHMNTMARGGWQHVDGPYFDDGNEHRNLVGLRGWLDGAIRDARPRQVWVPLGIGHPDHLLVADMVHPMAGFPNWPPFYAFWELPYYVLYPGRALTRSSTVGIGDGVGFGPLGPQLHAKRRLCNEYSSQIGPEIERCLYAPERLWEMHA